MGQNTRANLGLASTTSRALPAKAGEGFSLSPFPSTKHKNRGASGDTLSGGIHVPLDIVPHAMRVIEALGA